MNFSDMKNEELLDALAGIISDSRAVLEWKNAVVSRIRGVSATDHVRIIEIVRLELIMNERDIGELREPQWLKAIGKDRFRIRNLILCRMAKDYSPTRATA